MRLPLYVLAAALILLSIRWWVADGPPVIRSTPSPAAGARINVEDEALVRTETLEEVVSPEGGRQPLGDEVPASTELDAQFELRHRSDGPAQIFRSWSDLRHQRSVGIHEVGLGLFRSGRGVLHRGPQTEPDDDLASYWIDDQKRLVRVEIPEAGNHRLYRVHHEARWLESQINSFRWDAAEMQELSKTVFQPSGEGADVRREFLEALRAPQDPEPKIIDGPFGREIQHAAPSSERENRVRAARSAYMAARAVALDRLASGSEE